VSEVVITQDKSSGRVHVRIRRNGVLYDNPKCNQDDAGDYRVLEHEWAGQGAFSHCRNCFPEIDRPVEDDGSTQPETVP